MTHPTQSGIVQQDWTEEAMDQRRVPKKIKKMPQKC